MEPGALARNLEWVESIKRGFEQGGTYPARTRGAEGEPVIVSLEEAESIKLEQTTVDRICPLAIDAVGARLNRLGPDFSETTKTFKNGSSLSVVRATDGRSVNFVRMGVNLGTVEIINVSLTTASEVDEAITVRPATIFLNDLAKSTNPEEVRNAVQNNTIKAGLRLRQAFTDLFPIPVMLDQLLPKPPISVDEGPIDPTGTIDDHSIQVPWDALSLGKQTKLSGQLSK